MKKRKSFGVKLWLWFMLFAAAIFLVLWLLQTVFLQSFCNDMAIRGAERAAEEIAAHAGEADPIQLRRIPGPLPGGAAERQPLFFPEPGV